MRYMRKVVGRRAYYFFCFRYCGNEKKVVTLQSLCVAADEEL